MHRLLIACCAAWALCALACGPPRTTTAPEPVGPVGPIITFGPSITETVFALGHGERVVAVSSFVSYPPEAGQLPRVGGMTDPNLERIAALEPALILLAGRVPLIEQLGRRSGFIVHNATMDSLAQIEHGIHDIARVLGDEPAGHALWETIAVELEAIRAIAADRPRVPVLIVSTRRLGDLSQLFTVGSPSFVHELLTIAGGDNIFTDIPQPYLEASKERILARAPEVIIELQPGANLEPTAIARMQADWDAMPTLPAVRNQRIHILTEDYLLIPGPRIVHTARRILDALEE